MVGLLISIIALTILIKCMNWINIQTIPETCCNKSTTKTPKNDLYGPHLVPCTASSTMVRSTTLRLKNGLSLKILRILSETQVIGKYSRTLLELILIKSTGLKMLLVRMIFTMGCNANSRQKVLKFTELDF